MQVVRNVPSPLLHLKFEQKTNPFQVSPKVALDSLTFFVYASDFRRRKCISRKLCIFKDLQTRISEHFRSQIRSIRFNITQLFRWSAKIGIWRKVGKSLLRNDRYEVIVIGFALFYRSRDLYATSWKYCNTSFGK